jgi:hypothetical protein
LDLAVDNMRVIDPLFRSAAHGSGESIQRGDHGNSCGR